MASGINVKVATKKLITAMQAKVAEYTKMIAAYEAADKKFDAAVEKHEAWVKANAHKVAVKSDVTPVVRVNQRNWGAEAGKTEVEITYYIPNTEATGFKRPDWNDFKPDPNVNNVSDLKEQVKELNNAIRLLSMSDEEYVNTSTYKSVAKYL